jgi:aryl-alcohol dehydrogenase-like predicted oxidoreductase
MTDLNLERFILGTAQLGLPYGINNSRGQMEISESVELLERTMSLGVQCLDSSEAYGNAHEKIGTASRSGFTFKIFTKFLLTEDQKIEAKVDRFLNELQTESIEGLSFHRFSEYEGFTQWESLETLKKKGKISKLGVSVYTHAEMEACLLDSRVDLVQLPFNLLDSDTRKMELIRSLASAGKVTHTRSTFLQGLFQKAPEDFPESLQSMKAVSLEIGNMAKQHGMSITELALLFPFSFPCIHGVVIGMESESQLVQNLELLKKDGFDPALAERISNLRVPDPRLLNPANW